MRVLRHNMLRMKKSLLLLVIIAITISLVPIIAAATPASAAASATALTPMVTETGYITLSVDGLGTTGSGYIQVDKPAGATVRAAYMAATDVWGSNGGPLPNGAVKINGNNVNWSSHIKLSANNAWANVTSIVKPIVNAAAPGIVNLPITETRSLHGSILAVIFDDPNQTVSNTVIPLFWCSEHLPETHST